ncbi:hypothetical protein EVAR_47500_1 [Eumeta japonica]|uniref:Uncharacterized protein n=1 Tax=Eumeta variegata TaxID=151549 RepID=A0A4C1XS52_EUMVA|nr:hypothetical protein EVAR_47500_1 [Eumeta japonica]
MATKLGQTSSSLLYGARGKAVPIPNLFPTGESLEASVKMVCHRNQPFSIMERIWRSALGSSLAIPKSKIIVVYEVMVLNE